MNEFPFEYDLGQKMFYINRGEIIDGYIMQRECIDSLHLTGTREATDSKTRAVKYTFKESHERSGYDGCRGFGAVKSHELFKTKEEAAMKMLQDAGLEVDIVNIGGQND